MGNSLSKSHNLQELTFGNEFNQPLDNTLSNLTNLRILTLGARFNQSLENSLSNLLNLRELTLGKSFNQYVNIPGWITKLVINSIFSQAIIDYLPLTIYL